MSLSEEVKDSLVQYCGRRYESNNAIIFEYREIERLTRAAQDDSCSCFSYMKIGKHDLTQLDSKSFRVINRIDQYMIDKEIETYSDLFPDGKIGVSLKKNEPLIVPQDFYDQLTVLGIRKSKTPIHSLS